MENTDSIWGFIGIVVFACGIYALYSYVKMKKTGRSMHQFFLVKSICIKSVKIKKNIYIKWVPRFWCLPWYP